MWERNFVYLYKIKNRKREMKNNSGSKKWKKRSSERDAGQREIEGPTIDRQTDRCSKTVSNKRKEKEIE